MANCLRAAFEPNQTILGVGERCSLKPQCAKKKLTFKCLFYKTAIKYPMKQSSFYLSPIGDEAAEAVSFHLAVEAVMTGALYTFLL
jgi:hypothetical protein